MDEDFDVKVAVQATDADGMVNVVLPQAGQMAFPVQPTKVEPDAGVAERATVTPAWYFPAPWREPLPVPAVVNVTGYVLMKVPVQVTGADGMVNFVLPTAGQTVLPPQPAKVEPDAGVANTVTVAPGL